VDRLDFPRALVKVRRRLFGSGIGEIELEPAVGKVEDGTVENRWEERVVIRVETFRGH
jgi:hypothetical protein